MKYNFDEITDRKNTSSLKWDVGENELPMWVADMDFKTAPAVGEAIKRRAKHGVFGYSITPDSWYEAYIGWWKRRYNFEIKKDWLIFSAGVIPSVSSIVRKLTTPAENVLILTPVYNIFYNSILNNGRNVLECRLDYKNGEYGINFEDLEKKLSYPQTTMMLFCNPHNPVGKIWDAKTVARIGEMCEKHGVTVISDEIHCDITESGKTYVPFASASDICARISVTCAAPTKSFNIAGIQTSAVIIPNEFLRNRVCRALNTDEVAEPNCFAVCAAEAAYNEGEQWLDELRHYIDENKKTAAEFIGSNTDKITVVKSEATYLMWLDCKNLAGFDAGFIREKSGLIISDGAQYGDGGKGFLRLNAACPRALLTQGLERLKKAYDIYIGQ